MAEQPGSFTIDDAFEISLEEKESTTPRFGSLKFERKVNLSRTSGQAAGADDVGPRESGHKYRNLEDDEDEVRTNGAMPGDLRIRPPSRQSSELSFSTLDEASAHPEESQGGYRLLRLPHRGHRLDHHRNSLGGEPQCSGVERDLFRAWIPAVYSGSLSRNLHRLRRQGEEGFPILQPTLFRKVTADLFKNNNANQPSDAKYCTLNGSEPCVEIMYRLYS
ncbi:transmembrane protein 134 isoform X1 [Lampetra fluviatilis]